MSNSSMPDSAADMAYSKLSDQVHQAFNQLVKDLALIRKREISSNGDDQVAKKTAHREMMNRWLRTNSTVHKAFSSLQCEHQYRIRDLLNDALAWYTQHLETSTSPALLQSARDGQLLNAFHHTVNDHIEYVKWWRRITSSISLGMTGGWEDKFLSCFYRHIVCLVEKDLTAECVRSVHALRGAQPTQEQYDAVENTVALLMQLSDTDIVPRFKNPFSEFVTALQAQTRLHYAAAAKDILADDPTKFVTRTEAALSSEHALLSNVLPEGIVESVMDVLKEELLVTHLAVVLERPQTGVAALLTACDGPGFRALLDLYSQEPVALQGFASVLYNSVLADGSKYTADLKQGQLTGPQWMAAIRKLFTDRTDILNNWSSRTEATSSLLDEVRRAFDEILNVDLAEQGDKGKSSATTVTDLLARSVDSAMTDTNMSSDERMVHCVVSASLFSMCRDKESFNDAQRRYLSVRLFRNTTKDMDTENAFIALLRSKSHQGAGFTRQAEGMLQDFAASEKEQEAFETHVSSTGSIVPFCFQPILISKNFWPVYAAPSLTLPSALTSSWQAYLDFQATTRDGSKKKVSVVPSLGSMTLMHNSLDGGRKKTIVTSNSLQGFILLCFDRADAVLRYESIVAALQYPHDDSEVELKKALFALTTRTKVLLKSGDPKKLDPADEISINRAFTCPDSVFHFPAATAKAGTTAEKDTKDTGDTRSVAAEAAIVRIMKQEKSLPHAQLVQHALSDATVIRDARVLKEAIDSLIERNQICRSADDPSIIEYVKEVAAL